MHVEWLARSQKACFPRIQLRLPRMRWHSGGHRASAFPGLQSRLCNAPGLPCPAIYGCGYGLQCIPPSLSEILPDNLGKLATEDNPMPLGEFLFLASHLVFPRFRGRQPDVGHSIAVGHVAGFRVGTEIADENYFVDRSH